METRVIHICGASGAGTTTLARAISGRHGFMHLDTDDFYWELTNPPFTTKRDLASRQRLLSEAIDNAGKCVVSGSLCGWGDIFISKFDLVIYLHTNTELRIKRLNSREFQRFGDKISPGGDMHESHQEFIEWATLYDTGGLEIRSATLHREWLKLCACPVVKLDGARSIKENLKALSPFLK